MDKKQAAKKGAISIDYLITLIIAVIGFTLLLVFLYNVYWRQNIDREVCHESAVLRATLPVIAQSYMPLKCATEKICVTANFLNGECKEFKGDKGIVTVRVSSGDRG